VANAFFPGCLTVVNVTIENFLYAPETLTVQVGAMVRWTNLDLDYHTASSDTGAFETGRINQNESYQRIFDTPGTYPYYCAPHPYMRGTIVVTAP
jgi:plastocyanin